METETKKNKKSIFAEVLKGEIMQTYVMDIQSLYDKNHRMVPKEITIMSIDMPFQAHWILRSPHDHLELPTSIRNINRRMTRQCHGIEWSDGEADLGRVQFFLHRLAHTAVKIYVKGKNNVEYLESFMSCHISDVSKITPPIETLPEVPDQCILHGIERQEKYSCSYNRTKRLRRWIIAHQETYDNVYEPVYESVV